MRFSHVSSIAIILAAAGLTLSKAIAQAEEQILNLKEGWNTVHLRVTSDNSVAALFGGTPVDLVTTWYPEKQKVSSLQDPASETWKNSEWRTWQAVGQPGAFLNNLHALESGRAYLIKARSATTVHLTGKVSAARLRWQAQSFNLTGLPADPAGPATFGAFFAGSAAHQPLRVFRLVTGNWQPVSAATAINPDEAYWIWCGEGSEFQGPLDVRVAENPVFNSSSESISVGLLSNSANSLAVQVTATGNLPLAGVTRQRFTNATVAVIGTSPTVFSASSGEAQDYRISCATASPAAGSSSLLQFRAAGVRLTVPVRFIPSSSAP